MNQLEELLHRYDAWCVRREELTDREEHLEYVSPSEWEDSNETGLKLLREFAAAVRALDLIEEKATSQEDLPAGQTPLFDMDGFLDQAAA